MISDLDKHGKSVVATVTIFNFFNSFRFEAERVFFPDL